MARLVLLLLVLGVSVGVLQVLRFHAWYAPFLTTACVIVLVALIQFPEHDDDA